MPPAFDPSFHKIVRLPPPGLAPFPLAFFTAGRASGGDGRDAAPSPLAYLAAGVAFCFMTQLGRYAEIMKEAYHLNGSAVPVDA